MPGIGGRIAPECVDALLRNQWTACPGISGRIRPEYAPSGTPERPSRRGEWTTTKYGRIVPLTASPPLNMRDYINRARRTSPSPARTSRKDWISFGGHLSSANTTPFGSGACFTRVRTPAWHVQHPAVVARVGRRWAKPRPNAGIRSVRFWTLSVEVEMVRRSGWSQTSSAPMAVVRRAAHLLECPCC